MEASHSMANFSLLQSRFVGIQECTMDGFTVIRSDRFSSVGGGICFSVKTLYHFLYMLLILILFVSY